VLRIVRSPLAKADLVEHIVYLAERNPDIADRFITAAGIAFQKLAKTPSIGAEYPFKSPRLAGIRRWFIPGFKNHLIFYRVSDTAVEIVRVLHGAQNIEAILAGDEDE
jgi:toxin ParE1/3/4